MVMRQSVLIAGVIAAILAAGGNIFSANPTIAQQMLASVQPTNNTIPIFSSNRNIDNTTLTGQTIAHRRIVSSEEPYSCDFTTRYRTSWCIYFAT